MGFDWTVWTVSSGFVWTVHPLPERRRKTSRSRSPGLLQVPCFTRAAKISCAMCSLYNSMPSLFRRKVLAQVKQDDPGIWEEEGIRFTFPGRKPGAPSVMLTIKSYCSGHVQYIGVVKICFLEKGAQRDARFILSCFDFHRIRLR